MYIQVAFGDSMTATAADSYAALVADCKASWPIFDSDCVFVTQSPYGALTVCSEDTFHAVSSLVISKAVLKFKVVSHTKVGRTTGSPAATTTPSTAAPTVRTPTDEQLVLLRATWSASGEEVEVPFNRPFAAFYRAVDVACRRHNGQGLPLAVSFSVPTAEHEIDLEDDADLELLSTAVSRFGRKRVKLMVCPKSTAKVLAALPQQQRPPRPTSASMSRTTSRERSVTEASDLALSPKSVAQRVQLD